MFNTLFMLGRPERQEQAVRNVRQVLSDGASFLVEVLVATDAMLGTDSQFTRIRHMDDDQLLLSATKIDRADQTLRTNDLLFMDGSVRMFPYTIFYQGPHEVIAMIERQSFRLDTRWSDWRGTPPGERDYQMICLFRAV